MQDIVRSSATIYKTGLYLGIILQTEGRKHWKVQTVCHNLHFNKRSERLNNYNDNDNDYMTHSNQHNGPFVMRKDTQN